MTGCQDGAVSGSVLMMGWLSVVLLADSSGSALEQRLLGVATWLVLLVALRRATPLVRAQTLVVVAFATVVEYVASPGLGVYTYRLDNVPAYVPPGHGLVYLSAWMLGHSAFLVRHQRRAVACVAAGLGTWAVVALLQQGRPDVLGAFWFVCLLGFLRWGPSRAVYVGAAVVVTWLELLGTHLATWTWQPTDPTGLVPIGNPPTGAAGGYGWFDLVALLVAPTLLLWWGRVRDRAVGGPAPGADPVSPGAPVPDGAVR
jgi:hypothetical protein